MKGMLPAAAVPLGAKILIPLPNGELEITVSAIDNATPVPGKITFWDEISFDYVVGASQQIKVVELP